MVLSQIEESEDIRVPWFEVDRNRTLSLAATLVDVASGVVEDTEHRHDTVALAVGALDVGAL